MSKDETKDVADMLEALARRIRGDAVAAQVTVAPDDEPSLGALDVFTDDKNVTVTVETRNAEAGHVRVSLLEGRLLINLGEGPHAFRRDLPLPAAVDEDAAVATFRNGILDVVLPLKRQ
jgi:HSP20 family molecular chaperone IbpA